MLKTTTRLAKASRSIRHASSIVPNAPKINTLYCDIDNVPLEQFRQRAFIPEKPIRIIQDRDSPRKNTAQSLLPAQQKWFSHDSAPIEPGVPSPPGANLVPSQEYLSAFADTILPYELIPPPKNNPPQAHRKSATRRTKRDVPPVQRAAIALPARIQGLAASSRETLHRAGANRRSAGADAG
ncbi:hypothetical protein LAWI1_G006444 [Lachnellula willkommii]|uniref:Uncharacterized protein n=1 Tax=Lachnellula willkommii TaxID=215461 RepID=A0A559M1I6_9HELO|nr:hypothetical protein LAWI1_G006444 [Lachnellula willkommii]